MLRIISTDKAPGAIGPYSQAVTAGNMVFLSGQLPIDPVTENVIEGDISAQTQQVIKNIKAVLEEAGCGLNDVVKTTVFLKDMKQFGEMNAVYGSFFEKKPARSTVEVARLPKDVMVEIDCIAVIP